MTNFKLVYFHGCPNADRAKLLLRKANVSFEEVNQDLLVDNDSLRGYASPTLLWGRQIVFGARTGECSGGCTLEIPSIQELKNRISALRDSSEVKSGRIL